MNIPWNFIGQCSEVYDKSISFRGAWRWKELEQKSEQMCQGNMISTSQDRGSNVLCSLLVTGGCDRVIEV